ncbi:MAG: rhodanese-like domain-containing protein [Chloroflexi bacterium]|nr:rhodanese-like domain-containing protein [Chloroflexota bacterium]
MIAKRWIHPAAAAAFLVAVAAILGACGGSGDGATVTPAGVTTLGPLAYRDALAAAPGAFVVNVHTPYEGELPATSAFIAFDRIRESAASLPADKSAPLYIYCRSGRMSAEAAPVLRALGYSNIIDLQGGMNAWRAAGLAIIEKPP